MSRLAIHETIRQIAAGDEAAVKSFASLERRMNAERMLSVAPTEADVVKFLTGRSALHADIDHALFVVTNADGREFAGCAAFINRRHQEFQTLASALYRRYEELGLKSAEYRTVNEINLASRTLATSLGGEGRILYHNFDKALT